MKQAGKIRVAVLYGGRSAEHEVSLQSAANVIQYLDKSLFDVIPIGISKQGHWLLGQEIFLNSLDHKSISNKLGEEVAWFTPEWVGKPTMQSNTITSHSNAVFDVVFPVVHGTYCEDGTLQGLLELAGLPYVGCGVLSSAIGMDKDIAKRLAASAGILVGPYFALKKNQWETNKTIWVKKVAEQLSYPVFVKPANAGSSIGISKVKQEEQLIAAINEAFRFDTKILIEKALSVCELEVAVLESLDDSEDPIVSVVGEIKPKHEFYSYDAKYLDEQGADLLIPALLADSIRKAAQNIAKKLFIALECEGMARIDLFFNTADEKIYFNEINTIPGFTQISMYPKLMAASGIPYSDLLTHLVQLAIKKHQNRTQLIRSYAE